MYLNLVQMILSNWSPWCGIIWPMRMGLIAVVVLQRYRTTERNHGYCYEGMDRFRLLECTTAIAEMYVNIILSTNLPLFEVYYNSKIFYRYQESSLVVVVFLWAVVQMVVGGCYYPSIYFWVLPSTGTSLWYQQLNIIIVKQTFVMLISFVFRV